MPTTKETESNELILRCRYRSWSPQQNTKTKSIQEMSDRKRESRGFEEDPEEVRLKAFALLNRLGPTEEDDASTWPEKPTRESFTSYQKNENTKSEVDELRRQSAPPAYASNEYYEEWGLAGLMVSCIADACKKSADYAIKTGYESIYPDAKRTEGDFERVSILNTYRNTGQTSGEM